MAVVRGIHNALAGVLAAVVFAVFFFFLDLGLIISALCGVGGLVAGLQGADHERFFRPRAFSMSFCQKTL